MRRPREPPGRAVLWERGGAFFFAARREARTLGVQVLPGVRRGCKARAGRGYHLLGGVREKRSGAGPQNESRLRRAVITGRDSRFSASFLTSKPAMSSWSRLPNPVCVSSPERGGSAARCDKYQCLRRTGDERPMTGLLQLSLKAALSSPLSALLPTAASLGCDGLAAHRAVLFSSSLSPDGFQFVVQRQHPQ